jgi:hypothetical protein
MKVYLSLGIIAIAFLSACTKEEISKFEIPSTYQYSKLSIASSYFAAVDAPNVYHQIPKNTGTFNPKLDSFVIEGYERYLNEVFLIKKIDFISHDTIQLTTIQDGIDIDSIKVSIPISANNDFILGNAVYKINSDYTEISTCIEVDAKIITSQNIAYPSFKECDSRNINDIILSIMTEYKFNKKDSLGLYFLDMTYKKI